MRSSSLPVEIWRIILRLAVHVEGSLASSLSPECDHIQWLQWQYNDDGLYRQSMVAKLAFLSICKAWFIPAIELLYEDVRIKSIASMEGLYAALSVSGTGKGAQMGSLHSTGHGWWTKRLDLTPRSQEADLFEFAAFVAARMPNIITLTIHDRGTITPTFSNDDFPNLRRAIICSDEGNPHYFPRLESLCLYLTCGLDQVYPNLTFLELYASKSSLDHTVLGRYSFPRLRHLGVRYTTGGSLAEGLVTFLARHGSRLLSLDIASHDNVEHVNLLLRHAPHIEILSSALVCDGGASSVPPR